MATGVAFRDIFDLDQLLYRQFVQYPLELDPAAGPQTRAPLPASPPAVLYSPRHRVSPERREASGTARDSGLTSREEGGGTDLPPGAGL
jgi:hypothetical protein